LKIEKYLRLNASITLAKFEQIKQAKRDELREHHANAKIFLVDSLKQATIYVNGDKANISVKDVAARINDALGRLVSTVFHKFSYINAPMGIAEIRSMFKGVEQLSLALGDETEPNVLALKDMLSFISANSGMHLKTSMKSLLDRFLKAPYGFVEDDVEWLVAKLFKNGDIATIQGSI
jgi:hypothetical protein